MKAKNIHESVSTYFTNRQPTGICFSKSGTFFRQIKKDIPAELLPENQLTFPPSALRKKDRPRKVVEVSVVAGVEIIGRLKVLRFGFVSILTANTTVLLSRLIAKPNLV